jgi:hypothetical protein
LRGAGWYRALKGAVSFSDGKPKQLLPRIRGLSPAVKTIQKTSFVVGDKKFIDAKISELARVGKSDRSGREASNGGAIGFARLVTWLSLGVGATWVILVAGKMRGRLKGDR